jgi:hypothetical protein
MILVSLRAQNQNQAIPETPVSMLPMEIKLRKVKIKEAVCSNNISSVLGSLPLLAF